MSIINHTIEFNEIKDVGLLKTNTISDFDSIFFNK